MPRCSCTSSRPYLRVMDHLPVELLIHILSYALDVHPIPSNILCVNSIWNKILTPILHANIRLSSHSQLYLFGKTARLCRTPKRFSLHLSGGPVHFTGRAREGALEYANSTEEDMGKMDWIRARIVDAGGIWGCLRAALLRCPSVEMVALQLHSFVSDPYLNVITAALSTIK